MNPCVCGHAIEAHRDGAPGCTGTVPYPTTLFGPGPHARTTEPCGCAMYEPEEDEDDA